MARITSHTGPDGMPVDVLRDIYGQFAKGGRQRPGAPSLEGFGLPPADRIELSAEDNARMPERIRREDGIYEGPVLAPVAMTIAGELESRDTALRFYPVEISKALGVPMPETRLSDFPSRGDRLEEVFDDSDPRDHGKARAWLAARRKDGTLDRVDAAGGAISKSAATGPRGKRIRFLQLADGSTLPVPEHAYRAIQVPEPESISRSGDDEVERAQRRLQATMREHGPAARVPSPARIAAARLELDRSRDVAEMLRAAQRRSEPVAPESYAEEVAAVRRDAAEQELLDEDGRLAGIPRDHPLAVRSRALVAKGRLAGLLR